MANGHDVEAALLEGLERRGFTLRRSQILDEIFKIDAVVVAPPGAWENNFFPAPIGLQVTTHPGQWTKCMGFVRNAAAATSALAYFEIDLEGTEFSEAITRDVATALLLLFHDPKQPRVAFIRVNKDGYTISDLPALLGEYHAWLANQIPGPISGHIVRWSHSKHWGFAEAPIVGPSGASITLTFFVHVRSITDPGLKIALTDMEGELTEKQWIPVSFLDGDQEPGRDRKKAIQVTRRPLE